MSTQKQTPVSPALPGVEAGNEAPVSPAKLGDGPTNGQSGDENGAGAPASPPRGKKGREAGNKPRTPKYRAGAAGQKAKQELPEGLKKGESIMAYIERLIDERVAKLAENQVATVPAPRTPLIFSGIRNVMRAILPVAKTHEHPDEGFDFRRMDEICARLQPMLVEHGIFYMQTKVLKVEQVERPVNMANGDSWVNIFTSVTVEWRLYSAIDGSFLDCQSVGEAMSELHFSTPAAQTMAEKTMLCDTFCIPVYGEVDPEEISGERSQSSQPKVFFSQPEASKPATGATGTAQNPSLFDTGPMASGLATPATTTAGKKRGKQTQEPQTSTAGGAVAAETLDAPPPAQPLSKGFVAILTTNMQKKGVSEAQLFEHFKVENWEGLNTGMMDAAMAFINAPAPVKE